MLKTFLKELRVVARCNPLQRYILAQTLKKNG
jgi:magnesium-transporting ATPase (P-type)